MDKSIHTAEYERLKVTLRRARERAGLTQIQVGERLGVYTSFVSKVESGERRLDVIELSQFCELYGIGLVEFLKEADLA